MSWSPDKNTLENMRQYFIQGCKPKNGWLIGVERERIAVPLPKFNPLPYEGEVSVVALLEELANRYRWQRVFVDGVLLGLERDGTTVTMEPGGQIEFSSSPVKTVREVVDEVNQFDAEYESLSIAKKMSCLFGGINPFHSPEEIHWVPKRRYQIMKHLLSRKGSLGLHMMSLTSALQVSLDYGDEEDCQLKMRTAFGLVPILIALYANSPIYKLKKTGFISYRSHIWANTDPARCQTPAFVFSDQPLFEAYSKWALEVPIFFKNWPYEKRDALVEDGGRPFYELLRGHEGLWDTHGWRLHLSTLFPQIRLRRPCIEIRCCDSSRSDLEFTLPALCKGVFYNREACEEAWKMVRSLGFDERLEAEHSAAALGLSQGKMGRYRILELSRELLAMAAASLKKMDHEEGSTDAQYLKPLEEQILEKKRSPGEELLAIWENRKQTNPQQLIALVCKAKCCPANFRPCERTN